MFIADRFVFLELQKTGGSHIRRLLKQYTDGAFIGKHNCLHEKPDNKFVIGSVRNPWDWYVSLWAYGVSGKGAIRVRTSCRVDFNYYHRMLPKDMGKNWLTLAELLTSVRYDLVKPVSRWQQSYVDAEDAVLFRAWLKLLFDKKRRFDIGEGYGFSPLSMHSGLMTYRYFRLFTLGDGVFRDNSLADANAVGEYDKNHNILAGMIKMESLEDDFVRVLQDVGVKLTEQQIAELLNKQGGKTNVSKRKPVDFYYDEATADLVEQGDSYLIEKYGYKSPV